MSLPAWPVGLTVFLLVLAAQRGFELALSARHERALAARGAREHGAAHFPRIVLVHALFPVLLLLEVLLLGARPTAAWPLWFLVWLAAQALRYAAVRALGGRWTVRVWVPPDEEPIRRGPYRWLRHPNYLAVALELAAAPLMFGAWRTALVVSIANAIVLRERIRVEEEALAGR